MAEKFRCSGSYDRGEVRAMDTLFKTLARGGDVSVLLRSQAILKVEAKFAAMVAKEKLAAPDPAPKAKLTAQERSMNKVDRARHRRHKAMLKAGKPIPRPVPYVFTEWELASMCGVLGILSEVELAPYFGVSRSMIGRARRQWFAAQTARDSAEVSDCAAE